MSSINLIQDLYNNYSSIPHDNKIYLISTPEKKPIFTTFSTILSRLYYQFYGYSFDIRPPNSIIRQNINEIAQTNNPDHLRTALKVLNTTHSITCHVTIHRDKREIELQKQLIHQLLSKLSILEKKPIVQIALECSLGDLACMLIEAEHTIVGIPTKELQKLVPFCLKNKHEILLQLMALGVTIDKTQVNLEQLGEKACATHNERALLVLIELGMNCSHKTSQSIPLISQMALLGMENCIRKAIEKKLPLYELDWNGNSALHHAASAQNSNIFKLLAKYIDPRAENNSAQLPMSLVPINLRDSFLQTTSPIEKAYLEGKKVMGNVCREDFYLICSQLKQFYPSPSIDHLYTSHFLHNKTQFKQELELFIPGPPPEGVSVSDILELATASNLPIDQTRLRSFLHTVLTREALIGTPKAGTPALDAFYDQIELHIVHTIKTLQDEKNPNDLLAVCNEYAKASEKCGGKYHSIALEQYLRICHGKVETPLTKLYKAISEYRSICFQNAIPTIIEEEDHYHTHVHTYALKDMGEKYGIPGFAQAQVFDDPIKQGERRYFKLRSQIEAKFLALYTPSNLIHEWIVPLLKSDSSFKKFYVNWQKTNVPEWFEKNGFETEENRVYAYLEQFVYNGTELNLEAVLYCLERIGAISSGLSYRDKAKTATPIKVQESDLFTTLFTRVLDFFGF